MQEKIESLHIMYASWYGIVIPKPFMSKKHSLAHRGRQIRAIIPWTIFARISLLDVRFLNTGSI